MSTFEPDDAQDAIDQIKPHLRTVWSASNPPPDFAPDPRLYATDPLGVVKRIPEKAGLFIGASVMILSPDFDKPQPALLTHVYTDSNDLALTVSGQDVVFTGERPRINAIAVVPTDDPEEIQVLTITHVPHRIDAESACMLADGNTRNLINVTYYVAIHSMQAS